MVNIANCLWDIGFSKQTLLLKHLPLNWTLLIPFALYYFIQCLINPSYKLSGKEYFLLLPFGIQIAQKIVQLGLFLSNPALLLEWTFSFNRLAQALEITAIIYCIIVFILSIQKINRFQVQLQNQFADIERRSLYWVKNILLKVAFLLLLWIIPYVYATITNTQVNNYMYPLWIGMTIVVYWLGWSMFSKRDLFEYTPPTMLQLQEENNPISLETKKEKISPAKWEDHFQELIRLMEEKKLFLDFDISMTSLAEKMELSNGYLSQIINQKKGLNFYDYINQYRVEEVKKRLEDPKYSHLSLYGLAMDCGFKSKSTFNAVFKKMTGLTPSEYKKKEV